MALSPDGYETIILSANELRAHPSLKALYSLINSAFTHQHQAVFGAQLRFHDIDELIEPMGIHGRCCIMFKRAHQNSQPGTDSGLSGQNGTSRFDELIPIASATLKPFKQYLPGAPEPGDSSNTTSVIANGDQNITKDNGNGPHDILSILDWEPSAVVVRPEPEFQRLGLATRCMEQIERDLLTRMKQAELEASSMGADTAGQKRDDLTFWIRATAGKNHDYWGRRGYAFVGEETFPKGTWNAKEDFGLVTLKRQVPRLGRR